MARVRFSNGQIVDADTGQPVQVVSDSSPSGSGAIGYGAPTVGGVQSPQTFGGASGGSGFSGMGSGTQGGLDFGGGSTGWMKFVDFIQGVDAKNQAQNWNSSSSFITDPATAMYKNGLFREWFGWETPNDKVARLRQEEADRMAKETFETNKTIGLGNLQLAKENQAFNQNLATQNLALSRNAAALNNATTAENLMTSGQARQQGAVAFQQSQQDRAASQRLMNALSVGIAKGLMGRNRQVAPAYQSIPTLAGASG